MKSKIGEIIQGYGPLWAAGIASLWPSLGWPRAPELAILLLTKRKYLDF